MLLRADKVFTEGSIRHDWSMRVDARGRVAQLGPADTMGKPDVTLRHKLVVPGFINAHSHAFQRLLRGVTQVAGPQGDTFWTWRNVMYHVADRLTPEDVHVAARQAFLEMARTGITTVGEFHYLHNQVGGAPYASPTAMMDALVLAANDVGIRLAVIYTVYLQGDFGEPPSPQQRRFCAPSLDAACDRFDAAVDRLIQNQDPRVSWALAAHSVRGVPLDALVGLKTRLGHMPLHIHVSEQRREVERCRDHYGVTPIELLVRNEICDAGTTLVHATHIQPHEFELLRARGPVVCLCPTTEADLGDGLVPAADLFDAGVALCLGTDGQTQTSIVNEARAVEMHERLRTMTRNVITRGEGDTPGPHLMAMATANGARALGVECGRLSPGRWADFSTFDLNHPAFAGATDDTLLNTLFFSTDATAVSDVFVAGRPIIQNGQHVAQRVITESYTALCRKIFPTPATR